jgi:hypothetical protein
MVKLATRMFLYALILVVVLLVIMFQAQGIHGDDLYSEGSLTEWMQILVVTCVLFFIVRVGNTSPDHKRLTSLLAGIFTIALIRESDNAFDKYLFDGAWQVAAVFTLIITILMVLREDGSLRAAILHFATTPAFGFMAAGVLTVGLFSRLYGKKELWQAVMGERYMYSVKAASEENVELLGYCFILMAAIEWMTWCGDRRKEIKEG